jgi:2-iminobutanoate/2-iminopropanoate deaminase
MSRKTRRAIYSSRLPKPIAPYSPAIAANGFIFVSGQLGVDPKTGKLAGSTVEDQLRQALENARLILEEAGLSLKDVVKVTVYLANLSDFDKMNQVYRTYFPEEPPARTTVQATPPLRDALVEVELIGAFGE